MVSIYRKTKPDGTKILEVVYNNRIERYKLLNVIKDKDVVRASNPEYYWYNQWVKVKPTIKEVS